MNTADSAKIAAMNAQRECPGCSVRLEAEAMFCPKCGRAVGDPAAAHAEKGSRGFVRKTAALLGVCGLAAIGVWLYASAVTALPECGSPEAVESVVSVLLQDAGPDTLTPLINQKFRPSLDLIEKGSLTADGNVRTCSAQVILTLPADLKTEFEARNEGDGSVRAVLYTLAAMHQLPAIKNLWDSNRQRIELPLTYELKKLDRRRDEFLTYLPPSEFVSAFEVTVAGLAEWYQQWQAEAASVAPTAAVAEASPVQFTPKRTLSFEEVTPADKIVLVGTDVEEEVKAGASIGREDLDGDGVAELIVRATSSDYCGAGGCSTSVLRKSGDGTYQVIFAEHLFDGIGVTNEKVRGFHALCAVGGDGRILLGDKPDTPLHNKQLVYPVGR